MKFTQTSAQGVVGLQIVTATPDGNPLHLGVQRIPEASYVQFYNLVEHCEGGESPCQFRDEGRCCPQTPIRGSVLYDATRSAQLILGISPLHIAAKLLHTYSAEDGLDYYEFLVDAFKNFLNAKIEEDENG